MTINFLREEEFFVFQDPGRPGELLRRKTEIRFDPLTGESSRIVFDPGLRLKPPNYEEMGEKTGGKNCPFCPENVHKMTPKFSREIHEEDRIEVGEAIVFPNLFPYSKHNGVVVLTKRHYVPLGELTEKIMADALEAARIYLNQVAAKDPQVQYASINWNFLPYSGSSILHPHYHIIVSEHPTNYQAHQRRKARAFFEQNQKNYFMELLATEEKLQERWIKKGEHLSWCHAFAPKSHYDFIGIYPRINALARFTEEHGAVLAKDLLTIFRYLDSQGLASFNMMLNIPLREEPAELAQIRLVPRLTIGAIDTSDINFFQILQQEPLSYKVPEEVAPTVAALFQA